MRVGADDVRLSPYLIAGAVWSETTRSKTSARLFLGTLIAAPGIFWLANLPWLSALLAALGLAAALTASGSELLQLGSELTGRRRVLAAMTGRRLRRFTRAVPATDLRPGDWVCSHEDYERRCRRVEEANRRTQAHHEWRESFKEEQRRSFQRRMDESGLHIRQHEAPSLPPLLRRMPLPRLHRVDVVLPAENGKTVRLGYAVPSPGVDHPCDELFVRHHPESYHRAVTEPVGPVVRALVLRLSRDWRPEEDAVDHLVREEHAPDHVRWAVRAALAGNLVVRNLGPGRWARDLLALFPLPPAMRPRRSRRLKLTKLGALWAEADRSGREPRTMPQEHSVNYNFYDKVSFINSLFGSGVVNNNAALDPSRELAQVIVRYLDDTDARLSPEVSEALAELRAALTEKELPVPRVKRALNVIAGTGRALFEGGAGNALYDLIKNYVAG
ncbi:hypothetical protein ACIBEJ_12515 [Nonomuraea sp. NPDC050790]|uniref:hypothetical protein n=1 Tax=Nonomuraea sp. NPDC050790 TaxID=3364371 RepID=UPI0037A6F0B5